MKKHSREELVSKGFKRIPDFSGYVMNPDGDVVNLKTGKQLLTKRETSRYVKLVKDGKTHDRAISRLMREVFPEL